MKRLFFSSLKESRGSVFVEAAMLYPFIIIVTISMLFIFVYLYQMIGLNVYLNIEALRESGERSHTYQLEERSCRSIGEVKSSGIYETVILSHSKSFTDWGILKRTRQKMETGESLVIQESDFLRKASAVKELME